MPPPSLSPLTTDTTPVDSQPRLFKATLLVPFNEVASTLALRSLTFCMMLRSMRLFDAPYDRLMFAGPRLLNIVL